MKNIISGNTVVCDTGETKSFGMKVNAKAFSILVSGIYQFKIEAIIRELSTNAVDSQKQARNLVPFDVQLPTYDVPVFSIRDYGTGMSQKELEEIYFNFFASTKEDSNEYTGFIGIGSKSPLSYNTKSFNVESWKDGRHYIYLCFIGKDGIPDYNLVVDEETFEPDGLKVSVPVATSDIYQFKDCARKVYRWFDIKPNFISESADISDPCILRNDIYGIYNENRTIALMGNIAYPIFNHVELRQYENLINQPLVLFFDIGDIEFSASREGLEYTNRTINKLKEKFEEVISYIHQDLADKIDSSKSTFAAMMNFIKLKQQIATSFNSKDFLKNHFEYKGQTVTIKSLDIENRLFETGEKDKSRTTLSMHHADIYVHNDLKVGAIGRVKRLMQETGDRVVLLDFNNLPIDFDVSCYILASSLPKPDRNTQGFRQKVTSFMKILNDSRVTKAWEPCEIDDAQSNYYVIRNGYRIFHNGREYSPSEIFTMLKMMDILSPVYGIKDSDEESLVDEGFVNIFDVCKTKMDEMHKSLDLAFFEKFYKLEEISNKNNILHQNVQKIKHRLSPDHELLEIIELRKLIYSNYSKFNEIKNKIYFLNKYGYNITSYYKLQEEEYNICPKFKELNKTIFYNENVLYYYILGVSYENSREKF